MEEDGPPVETAGYGVAADQVRLLPGLSVGCSYGADETRHRGRMPAVPPSRLPPLRVQYGDDLPQAAGVGMKLPDPGDRVEHFSVRHQVALVVRLEAVRRRAAGVATLRSLLLLLPLAILGRMRPRSS